MKAEVAILTMSLENVPSQDDPRTGRLVAVSFLARVRGLVSALKVAVSVNPRDLVGTVSPEEISPLCPIGMGGSRASFVHDDNRHTGRRTNEY